MEAIDLIKILVGMNGIMLVAVITNAIRTGRLEGRLNNGDYLRCPFYRGNNPKDKCKDKDKKPS